MELQRFLQKFRYRVLVVGWGRSFFWAGTSLVFAIALGSCNQSALEKTFSADPKAEQWNMASEAKLSADFPSDLKYPNAVLTSALPIAKVSQDTPGQETHWSSSDSQDKILAFYRQRLKETGWTEFKETNGDGATIISALKNPLEISVSIPLDKALLPPPQSTPKPTKTDFKIVYRQDTPMASSTGKISDQKRMGSTSSTSVAAGLQAYVNDVSQLNVLSKADGVAEVTGQPISRALFARWLVEANNRIYRDRPARQIRLAETAKPAFQDVGATHPDFAYIQGLAEAGYLPSPLSGDNTQARFRPNDSLTRETLLLWKVPVDRQQILPTVSSDRVKQLWGFKDSPRITPVALSAVAADHQNSDLSNIRRVFGSTLLFQPQKLVTEAEAAASLWFIGVEGESLSVQDLLRSEQQINVQSSQPTSEPSASGKPKTNTSDPNSTESF